MENLFNAAALDGGYYNTAALDGGSYNDAALEGGSMTYDDAAVIGGFALAELASASVPPSVGEMTEFGYKTLKSLPPTVRDTIAKMFKPLDVQKKYQIYSALAMLYLLDSLKAISIAPEIDVASRKLARQRWILLQQRLQKSTKEYLNIYTRLLRYIHIPHHGPRVTKAMCNRWRASINNRSIPWGRSKAYHALPPGLSTRKYNVTSWTTPAEIPSVRVSKKEAAAAAKKRTAKKSTGTPAAKKRRVGISDSLWTFGKMTSDTPLLPDLIDDIPPPPSYTAPPPPST